MKPRAMLGNTVMVKLDPENEFIQTPSGIRLYIDTSFEPEKHIVRTGTVVKTPARLSKSGGSSWTTEMELQEGDQVIMYFLAIQNCLAPERKLFIKEDKSVWIFIKYHNIYAAIRDGKIIPINGYVLVEPMENPAWLRKKEAMAKAGLVMPDLRTPSKTDVVYGKIAYLGKPNLQYNSDYKTDANIFVKEGDEIIMKRIRDIPIEYEYHAKIDGGRKLYRIQRHDIIAVL